MFYFFLFCVVALLFIIGVIQQVEASPEEKEHRDRLAQERFLVGMHGHKNAHMVCVHCNTTGQIRTKPVTQKKGISGGKATAALLTSGVSLIAVGLSRKEKNTQAFCTKCQNTWFF